MRRIGKTVFAAAAVAALVATTATAASAAPSASTPRAAARSTAASASHHPCPGQKDPVSVHVVSPRQGDATGIDGKAWIVDLKLDYPSAAAAGFTAPQLTGPAAHANTAPFPGAFSTGADDRLPGLVVLDSTTNSTVTGFSGPGTNLANLFNLTSITNQTKHRTQIQDTWIVGAPIAGVGVDSTVTVAVVGDLNHDGVYNDAPAVVPDANHDGRVDAKDLRALGVVGNIETVRFHINGTAS